MSAPMTPPESVPDRARRACEKCTRTKKKCDKALPKCERCTRLSTACCYNFVYAPPTLTTTDSSFLHLLRQQRPDETVSTIPSFAQGLSSASSTASTASSTVLAPAPHLSQFGSSPSATAAHNLVTPPGSGPNPPFDPEISARSVLSLISSRGRSWRDVADLYYERVHHWMGVVQPDFFRAKVDAFGGNADEFDIETALLVLCMYLSVRPLQDAADEANQPHLPGYAAAAAAAAAQFGGGYPVPAPGARRANTPPASWPSIANSRGSTPPPAAVGTEGDMLASPVYRTAKRLLVLLRAFSPPSIELVQCGTLVALYELGHGDPWRAYVTFGEALTMSKLIGIQPGLWVDGVSEDEPVEIEEDQVCSLYWALFVLDKMLHFDFAFLTCPLQMQLPPPTSLLPAQNHLWSVTQGRRVEFYRRIPYSAPPTKKRLGPFQRAIQAAVLAHRAMMWEEHVRLTGPGRPFDSAAGSFVDLDAQARNLIEVIIFQEEVFAENCEALGMCFGVMLMLHATVLGGEFDARNKKKQERMLGLGMSSGMGSPSGCSSPHEEDIPRALAGINFVIRMVGDSSADANARMSSRPGLSNIFSPATAYAAYHALRVLSTLENAVEDADSRFHDIYCCMFFLAKRWGLAGRLLGIIESLLEGHDDDEDSMPGMSLRHSFNHTIRPSPPRY